MKKFVQNVSPNLADFEGNSLLLCTDAMNSLSSWQIPCSQIVCFSKPNQTSAFFFIHSYLFLAICSSLTHPSYTVQTGHDLNIQWSRRDVGIHSFLVPFLIGIVSHKVMLLLHLYLVAFAQTCTALTSEKALRKHSLWLQCLYIPRNCSTASKNRFWL